MNSYSTRKSYSRKALFKVLLLSACLLPFQDAATQEKADQKKADPKKTEKKNADESLILNLKNVDIRSLIETVSRRTGKNFIVDPRVKATVNMISSEPVDQDNLYDIFLSVLEVHGYAAVTAGAVIKIVPSSVGAQTAIPVLNDSSTDSGSELISRVIVLRAVPAQQMVETLRPLIPQSASIGAEGNSNTIVVTDRADNIEKLLALINMMDRN